MGDGLPEMFYRAWCAAMGHCYGSDDAPGYNNLNTDQRYAWERVAAEARRELSLQFRRDLRAATDELGAEQAIANLLGPEGAGT